LRAGQARFFTGIESGNRIQLTMTPNVTEVVKSSETATKSGVFGHILPLFELLSLRQPGYSAAPNRAVLRGPAARFFSISRRLGMAKGTVKWFNPTKGYGFIQPSSGGKDVFVHISAVQKAGLSTLNEGQSIEYEEIANRGKTSAENLKV
jgi:CspA family cold shock protein